VIGGVPKPRLVQERKVCVCVGWGLGGGVKESGRLRIDGKKHPVGLTFWRPSSPMKSSHRRKARACFDLMSLARLLVARSIFLRESATICSSSRNSRRRSKSSRRGQGRGRAQLGSVGDEEGARRRATGSLFLTSFQREREAEPSRFSQRPIAFSKSSCIRQTSTMNATQRPQDLETNLLRM
jgi:hypothetical protein